MDEKPYVPPAGIAEMFAWVTVTHMVLIAILAAGAVTMLWWGRKLRRERKQAREEAERAARERDEPR
jgi:Flp pilus assembly protein TadB